MLYPTDARPFRRAYDTEQPFRLHRYIQVGWGLLRREMGTYVLATGVAILCYILAGGLAALFIWLSAAIPFLNAVVILTAYLLRYAFAFAFSAGLFRMSQRLFLTRQVESRDMWSGLKRFWQIAAAKTMQVLLLSVPMLLLLTLAGISSYDELTNWAAKEAISPLEILQFYREELRLLILGCVPYLLIQGLYLFSSPLILLGNLPFWTAMEISRKIAIRHWRGIVRLLLFISSLWLLSFLTLGLMLWITFPLTYTVVYAAYADLTDDWERFWGQ